MHMRSAHLLGRGAQPEADERFIRFACDRSGIGRYGVFKVVWAMVCRHMMRWLIVERKSIDFGWFVIHPVPHHMSWKYHIMRDHPEALSTYSSRLSSRPLLEVRNRMKALVAKDFLIPVAGRFYNNVEYTQWMIEIEYKQRYFTYMRDVEIQRIKAQGRSAYFDDLQEYILTKTGIYHEIFGQFVQKAGKTIRGLLRGTDGSDHGANPFHGYTKSRPVRRSSPAKHPDRNGAEAHPVGVPPKSAPVAPVPEVPDPQPIVDDLWDAGGGV